MAKAKQKKRKKEWYLSHCEELLYNWKWRKFHINSFLLVKMHEIIDAKLLGDYRIFFTFVDLKSGEVDCEKFLTGRVFESLKDPKTFQQFRVDTDLDMIVWENGAHISPDTLSSCLH